LRCRAYEGAIAKAENQHEPHYAERSFKETRSSQLTFRRVRSKTPTSSLLLYSCNALPVRRRYADVGLGSTTMFDVYLNDKRDLLVVRKGLSIPIGDTSTKWRKSKKRVVSVSEEIRQAVEKQGYYLRGLRNFRNKSG
jgi:hypothetical protein